MATTRGQSRRCARTGCRAWAMRGDTHCRVHRSDAGEADDADGLSGERHQPTDRFAEMVRAGQHAELIEVALQAALNACARERSLVTEIGALRLMLQRVVATDLLDGDSRETTQTMTRLVDAIIRALRMEQALAASFDDELCAAVTRVFAEQGWLEDA